MTLFAGALAAHGAALLVSRQRCAMLWRLLTLAGVLFSGLAVAGQYRQAWPMLPMYLGMPALAVLLGSCLVITGPGEETDARAASRILQGACILLCIVILLFPKDFYLPLLRSATPWAHLFFVTGALARTFLLVSAARALVAFVRSPAGNGVTRQATAIMRPSVWGFSCLTLSMFCGELWSWLGWGTPVVWHDPAITLVMALWFYWLFLFHLTWAGVRAARPRLVLHAIGGLLVLVTMHPDLGPLRLPLPR